MNHCDIQGFTSTTYDSSPRRQQHRCKRRYTKPNQTEAKVKFNRPKGTFKYGLGVPNSLKSVVRIDRAARNTSWQDAVKKEVGGFGVSPVL